MSVSKPYQVLMILYEGFDILDFVGPAEFLSLTRFPGVNISDESNKPFNIVVTSPSDLTITSIGVKVASHIGIREAYDRLAEFDILIVPGGSSNKVLASNAAEPMTIIDAFATLPPRPEADRIIMSVCTGALFMAKAGVLRGQIAMTNSGDMDRLRAMVAGTDTTVVSGTERFVVNRSGGVNGAGRKGYRMMLSRGPGAGFDLTMWLVDHLVGEESRKQVEKLVEYTARLDEGLVL